MRRPPEPSIPHSANEEYLAYGNFVFILTGLITACVALTTVSWKVSPGSGDAFGVKVVHMDGDTHNLETMGCVWGVYTASRSAMGFTVLGILMSARAMWKTYQFCANSKKTVMIRAAPVVHMQRLLPVCHPALWVALPETPVPR